MRAVVYSGAYDVQVKEVEEPRIEHPADAIVRITTTNICGSDLHMYEGRTSVEQGKILGHENMGIVEEVGPTVAVFGAGPVGLMAALSAFVRGAARVFVVDEEPDRLKLAESIGADAVDFSKGDPVDKRVDGWTKVQLHPTGRGDA